MTRVGSKNRLVRPRRCGLAGAGRTTETPRDLAAASRRHRGVRRSGDRTTRVSDGGDRGDVPFDLEAVADAAHERCEAAVGRVDGQPARGTSARVAECVGHPWWNSDEPASRDNDRFRVAPELEGQFSLEDVEGIGVFVVNVRARDLFASCVARVGERHFLGCTEDADLVLPAKDRFALGSTNVGGGRDGRSSRIEVVPVDRVPGRAVWAALAGLADRRFDRVAAADRVP